MYRSQLSPRLQAGPCPAWPEASVPPPRRAASSPRRCPRGCSEQGLTLSQRLPVVGDWPPRRRRQKKVPGTIRCNCYSATLYTWGKVNWLAAVPYGASGCPLETQRGVSKQTASLRRPWIVSMCMSSAVRSNKEVGISFLFAFHGVHHSLGRKPETAR